MLHEAVILAGGQGSRLKDVVGDKPKCLVEIGHRPILYHQFDLLRKHGLRKVLILAGEKADQVVAAADQGKQFGLEVTVLQESRLRGTAWALHNARSLMADDVVLLYGDTLLNVDLGDMLEFARREDAHAVFAVKASGSPHASTLFEVDPENSRIVELYPTPRVDHTLQMLPCDNQSFCGVAVIGPDLLNSPPTTEVEDFVASYLQNQLGKHCCAYNKVPYAKDVGTLFGLKTAANAYRLGLLDCEKRGAIFLDRDGVLNEIQKNGFVNAADEFHLRRDVARGVELLRQLGFFIFVVTNQGGIELGHLTSDDLREIHHRADYLLETTHPGACIDKYYHCPHFNADCGCRKPLTGMITQAAEEYPVNLYKSFVVGDMITDLEMADHANITSALVISDLTNIPEDSRAQPHYTCASLLEFAILLRNQGITAV